MVRGSPNPRYLGLPSRLQKARTAAGLTRMEVVARAGGSKAAAHDIETRLRVPMAATVARLASSLGLAAGWLAYGLGEPTGVRTNSQCEGMGMRLQSVRLARGLSKAELGRVAGLTAPSISQIEAGGQSGINVIEALAKALGINPAWLAFNEGPQVLPARRRGRPAAQSPADAR